MATIFFWTAFTCIVSADKRYREPGAGLAIAAASRTLEERIA
jgi:hypothetical protein